MDVFGICGIAVVTAVLAVTVKQFKPELALQIGIAGGAMLLIAAAAELSGIAETAMGVLNEGGIDKGTAAEFLKIAGIACITQIAAELCRDAGEGALACKTELCGKVMVIGCALPAVVKLLKILLGLLASVE